MNNLSSNWQSWFRGSRGPYGEILPPPLVEHVTEEEALAQLVADNAALGAKVSVPQKGHARDGLINVALLYAHQMRLRQVLAGRFESSQEEALYEAVTMDGEPLSLRPLGLEWTRYPGFVPVLQAQTPGRLLIPRNRVGPDKPLLWRFGINGRGYSELFAHTDPVEVVAKAQALYVQLSRKDAETFEAKAKALVDAAHPSLLHDYALWQLDSEGEWNRGAGFRLQVIGSHNTMRLDTPSEARPVSLDPARAVKLLDALARQEGATADWPHPAVVAGWLARRNTVAPEAVVWGNDNLGLPAQIRRNGAVYMLEQRDDRLRVLANGRLAAEVLLELPLERWLSGELGGRPALALWAVWAGSGGAK